MRVLFLGNNRVGLEVLKHLRQNGDEIVGLVLHPVEKSRFRSEIIEVSGVDKSGIFSAPDLKKTGILDRIRSLNPEIVLSIYFGYILREPFLNMFPDRIINLHPAYLPFNRGGYPNVWSIIDGTPAGATLHFIDPGVDTGDIIAQKSVDVDITDTGISLYGKLEEACISLFKEQWQNIASGNYIRQKQSAENGTIHRDHDVGGIDLIDLEKNCKAGELINLLRARTFPPYDGTYFIQDGRKIFMRLELYEKPDEALTD